MKKQFRIMIGFIITIPFYILINVFSLFIGRKEAIKFWGPVVTFIVKIMAEISLIPKVKSYKEFDVFVAKMKRNISFLGILYDVSVTYEDNDTIILNYKNCPHCEAFFTLGLSELGQYACDSDWEIARDNSDLWDFERNNQIGTGDNYCNHTYKRKEL